VLLVRLWPRSTVHTWPSNQTLFGALCWAVSALYGTARLEELLRRLADDPQELVLSSCMPVLDVGDGVIFLVPKPVVWQAELPGAAGSRRRAVAFWVHCRIVKAIKKEAKGPLPAKDKCRA